MSEGSDRDEDLEQRVAELEATVRGLTEELVDATERIRQLERETDVASDADDKRARRERKRVTPAETEESDEGDTTKAADPEDSEETEESESDDIIVA